MARAALNDDVALLQLHVALVEDQRDLALQHDRVIDGLRTVHHRMAAALAESRGLAGPALPEERLGLLRRQFAGFLALRRNDGDAEHVAVFRRLEGARPGGGLGLLRG